MKINSLKLKNFRNYDFLSLNLNPATNIFYGDNAQGKTNILESIYLCGTSKSHRGTKDRDMIFFGQDESHIEAVVDKRGITYQIDMHLKKNKPKGIAINHIPIKKASEIFGILNVVFFSPEDLNIIKNGPSERRRFVDVELSQISRVYLNNLSKYHRIVNQRNHLLKDIYYNDSLKETLDIWDMQLIQYGKELIQCREEFVGKLNEMVRKTHSQISGGKENLVLSYEPNAAIERFEEKLALGRDTDVKMRTTTTGPHRDDISFLVDDIDIRRFGSQGQQRTAALSLKLSEIELVKELVKDYPVLLLDDVLSELDGGRQEQLLSGIKEIQTMITCTGVEDFVNHRFPIDRIYKVVNGTVAAEN